MSDVKPAVWLRPGRNLDSGAVNLSAGMGERSRPPEGVKRGLSAQTDAAAIPANTTNSVSRRRGFWALLWVSILACALASGWLGFRNRSPPELAEHEISARIHAPVLGTAYSELPEDPRAALTAGMDRLNAAVAAKHAMSQEELLTVASRSGHGCALAFANHLPSVVFGAEPVQHNSLARTLSDCAEAVSKEH
jgi:hypothetical protein